MSHHTSEQSPGRRLVLLTTVVAAVALLAWTAREQSLAQVSTAAGAQTSGGAELHELLIQLNESTTVTGPEDAEASTNAWICYGRIKRLLSANPGEATLADNLVLANFALLHADLEQGNHYLAQAGKAIEAHPSKTVQCLALMATGHMHFKHFPRTELARGRQFYEAAVKRLDNLEGRQRQLLAVEIYKEWSLDEYSMANAEAGDKYAAEARANIDAQKLPAWYVKQWQAEFSDAIVHAKVQSGLL